MTKAPQPARWAQVRRALLNAVMGLSWLGGLAAGAALLFAGYLGMGAPILVALARVAATHYLPRTSTPTRRFPRVILWAGLDALTLLGAGLLILLGALPVLTALTTPPWWAAIPGLLAITAGLLAIRPPLKSISRIARRSPAAATV